MMLPATGGNISGTPVLEQFSVPSSHLSGSLQYPEIFVPLRQTLYSKWLEVIRSQIRRKGWVFLFSNQFLCQKLLDGERPVSWSIVMVGNSIVGIKFRPFSTHSFM
jgi:hypothetical protein